MSKAILLIPLSAFMTYYCQTFYKVMVLIPVAVRSKVQACCCLIAGIAGSNPAEGMGIRFSFFSCCVGSSLCGDSLVQRSPTGRVYVRCRNLNNEAAQARVGLFHYRDKAYRCSTHACLFSLRNTDLYSSHILLCKGKIAYLTNCEIICESEIFITSCRHLPLFLTMLLTDCIDTTTILSMVVRDYSPKGHMFSSVCKFYIITLFH